MPHTLSRGYTSVECPICGLKVPSASINDHLLADIRLLKIIQATHPAWSRLECEDYYRSLNGGDPPQAGPREVS